jgi:hypothetical protein
MFVCNLNKPFAWPSVLGEATGLRDFWKGRAPPAPHPTVLRNNPSLQRDLARLTLPPLRMISIENTVAQLGVDIRWLLLAGALCEVCVCVCVCVCICLRGLLVPFKVWWWWYWWWC